MPYQLFKYLFIASIVVLILTFPRSFQNRFIAFGFFALSIVVLIYWSMFYIPPESKIQSIEGRIIESYHSSNRIPDVIFRLQDQSIYFRYKTWFPKYSSIEPQLRIDNVVTVYYTINRYDSTRGDIWQIKIGGKSLVTRDEMVNTLTSDIGIAPYLVGAFVTIGTISLTINYISNKKDRRLTRRSS